MTPEGIWTIDDKKELKLLRKKMRDCDFSAQGGPSLGGKKTPKQDRDELVKRMRKIMKESNGIGLSANQIGLDLNVFVAQDQGKFYAVFNPKITKLSEDVVEMEEGCLSVPEVFGIVVRSDKLVLEGLDKNGRALKVKAWGLLARIFQHEVDHLNGKVFIDTAKDLHKYEVIEK